MPKLAHYIMSEVPMNEYLRQAVEERATSDANKGIHWQHDGEWEDVYDTAHKAALDAKNSARGESNTEIEVTNRGENRSAIDVEASEIRELPEAKEEEQRNSGNFDSDLYPKDDPSSWPD